ncbi:dihydroxy-acid dehydratase, partial [Geobacillus sp. PA-3]
MSTVKYSYIECKVNPYRDNVQGKANEPICVAGLLDRSKQILGSELKGGQPDWTLEEIYDRLHHNAPRIAIIGGSLDHPAHIMDFQTIARAAIRIWQ